MNDHEMTPWTSLDLYYKGVHVKKSMPENISPEKLIEGIDAYLEAGFKPSWNEDTNKAANGDSEDDIDLDDLETPGQLCPVHNVKMQKYTKDDRSWYSHTDGKNWCSGNDWK